MIKKIPVDQLRIGMYLHDLSLGWVDHPFALNRFKIDKTDILDKIRGARVKEVSIDTELGLDVQAVEGGAEAADESLADLIEVSPNVVARMSPAEEFRHAREIYAGASSLMQDIMRDVRLGKPIQIEQCEPVVDGIVDSMFRFPSVLLPLAQIKTSHEYTIQHSAAVAALSVAFGKVLDMSREEIRQVALGGLLHDVGKAMVPGRLINKPGKLSEAELETARSHVVHTAKLLSDTHGISEIAFNAASQHHERFDGTGYPGRLNGERISIHGQMLAIVDVYDAITSIRAYHKGLPPTETLRKMFGWGGSHFNPTLVQAFIKGIGIYPAGSLVRLESNRLGIVREILPDKLLQPVVQVIYDCKERCHIDSVMVDLSKSNDRVKSNESFEYWGIPQAKWAAAHVG